MAKYIGNYEERQVLGTNPAMLLHKVLHGSNGEAIYEGSQLKLARLLKCCTRTIRRSFARLSDWGLVTVMSQKYLNKNGLIRTKNTYIIHYDKIAELFPSYLVSKEQKQAPKTTPTPRTQCPLILPLTEKEYTNNNIAKPSAERVNEEPSSKVSSVEEIKTFLEAEVGRLGAQISEVKKESFPESLKNDLIGHIELKRNGKIELLQELNAYADLLPTMTKTEQRQLNRTVRAEFGHLRGMELPYNTKLTPAWEKVMEDRGIHEDHRDWVFKDFCQFWWEDVHETKINPISMNWFRVWERRITFLGNSCDWYRQPMTEAEYNRRMRELMGEQEEMSGSFKKSMGGSVMTRLMRNSSPQEKMLEEKPKSNIDESILRILRRVTDEDGAKRAWMSWFMGNEVRIIQDDKEYNLCMKAGSSFKKDYIQTHYRDVVETLKIKIVA